MIGAITRPATGSAHHQPKSAFRSNPPNRIADKYVQKSASGIGIHGSALDSGSNPAFRSRKQRHDHDRHGGDQDAGNAAFGCFVHDQRGTGFENDVQRQHDKTRTHNSQGGSLDLFMPGVVKIVVEPPKQRRTGCHFDDAVQAKANERDRTSDQPGDDGDQTFGAVVGDGEVFEALAPANKILAILSAGCRHCFIIPGAHRYSGNGLTDELLRRNECRTNSTKNSSAPPQIAIQTLGYRFLGCEQKHQRSWKPINEKPRADEDKDSRHRIQHTLLCASCTNRSGHQTLFDPVHFSQYLPRRNELLNCCGWSRKPAAIQAAICVRLVL